MRVFLYSAALIAAMAPAYADTALVLGTERYETQARLARGADVVGQTAGIEALGFKVFAVPNGRAANSLEAVKGWLAEAEAAERLIVVLSGRFANDGETTWFLTAEAEASDPFSLGGTGLAVQSLLEVLASRPGGAMLLLGHEDETKSYGPYLQAGLGPLDVPQGVSVIEGAPSLIASVLGTSFAQAGTDLRMALPADAPLKIWGYRPYGEWLFMPKEAPVPSAPPAPAVDSAAEGALWEGAVALDTVEAYRNYLTRYPAGQYAAKAEDAIAAIVSEPNRNARLVEEGLNLSRDQRRAIQRNLTLLDYGTRGVDGIFGNGTRAAVSAWQKENRYDDTSYLTAEQITRLEAQAARRSAEIEAEAERQRQVAEAADRNFWTETGEKGDEPGLRAYLDRYPEGIYATNAKARLSEIEGEKRKQTEAREAEAWDRARAADSRAAYEDYMTAYPNGRFLAEARGRIAELSRVAEEAASPAVADARRSEEALGLNAMTARVVEERLQALGLEPGAVDGQFDEDTRRALRAYQRDRNLESTGYLSEATLVRLLADTLLGGR